MEMPTVISTAGRNLSRYARNDEDAFPPPFIPTL